MRKIKFIIVLFSFMFIFLSSQVFANAMEEGELIITSVGNQITQEEFNNLKRMGFTEVAIDRMPFDIIEQNKSIIPENVVESTTYQEVTEISPKSLSNYYSLIGKENYDTVELTEEEYFNRVNSQPSVVVSPLSNQDTTTTSYRRLTTTVSKTGGNQYRLHNRFIWDRIPVTRSHDTLSVSIDSTFTPVPNSNYGQQIWTAIHPIYHDVDYGSASYGSSSARWSKQGAGYGVKMNLKNDYANYRVVDLQGYAYYNIERSSSVVPYYVNAYGNYSHANKNVSSNYSYGLSFGGPSISWSGVSSTSFSHMTTHARMRYSQ